MIPAKTIYLEKPRLLVFYDQDGWVFHRIALRVQAFLNNRGYVVKISPTVKQSVPQDIFEEFDGILLIWWNAAIDFLERIPKHMHVFTFFYDHFTQKGHWLAQAKVTAYRSSAVFASSKILQAELKARAIHHAPDLFRDGVDSNYFQFHPLRRRGTLDRLRIGWAGNSKLGLTEKWDLKGLSILKEAAKLVPEIDLVIADRYDSPVSYEKMSDWYAGIDVYAIASESEGTPNGALEAASTGRPIISTSVGIVPELLSKSKGGWIIPERTVNAFVKAFQELARGELPLALWGGWNREEIERAWTWEKQLAGMESVLRRYLKSSERDKS